MPLAGLTSKEHWYQGSVTKPNLIIIFSKHLIQHILIKAQNRLSYVFETRNYFIGWCLDANGDRPVIVTIISITMVTIVLLLFLFQSCSSARYLVLTYLAFVFVTAVPSFREGR